MTEEINNLTTAHNKFLLEVGTIHKDATAQYGRFADLSGVLSVVNPALAKCGLSVFQTFAFTPEGQHVLHTTLYHVSGEKVQSSVIFPTKSTGRNPLHDWGGTVTYLRRFTLLAILGIAAGIEDLDGDHADASFSKSEPTITTQQPRATTTTRNPPADKAERDHAVSQIAVLKTSNQKAFNQLHADYSTKFELEEGDSFRDHIQESQHLEFIADWFVKNAALIRA